MTLHCKSIRLLPTLLMFALGGCTSSGTASLVDQQTATEQAGPWHLVWSDEFAGKEIDLTRWGFEVNCYGGGNAEQQCYTDRADNAFVHDGILNIVAKSEVFSGPALQDDDVNYDVLDKSKTLPYTSARLRSAKKGDWQYGRFEIRAKLPQGQGTWPAIWMLPTDWVYGGWAASGEIDIMEAVNLKARSDREEAEENELEARVHGTLHYGRSWPDNVYSGQEYRLPNDVNPADGFHTYAIEWQAGEIRWYVDEVHYATQRSSGWYSQTMQGGQLITGDSDAPFNQPFHLILNLAVGGAWAGNVNDTGIDGSVFPQTMQVDFVRVYECSLSPATGVGCSKVDDSVPVLKGHQAPVFTDITQGS
ncbi:glycoside hydrolase family 16 protein [Shewanella colwelliana]|uniref:Beta-glucanase n=1 Tax=Shewanella colwelliana TaxID=23 RepID=A0ABQ4PFW1_SHECO|nr:glycoside hydrolase family 16 protein [Shewanella colwelliana]GIU46396.1 beta-glucanase [Shewanella colwelliana]